MDQEHRLPPGAKAALKDFEDICGKIQMWSDEDYYQAASFAAENPHLSFHLRKALAHINFLDDLFDKHEISRPPKVAAAGDVC